MRLSSFRLMKSGPYYSLELPFPYRLVDKIEHPKTQ